MALRISWSGSRLGLDASLTVYWFPGEPEWQYVPHALGGSVSTEGVELIAPPDMAAGWSAAAIAYVDAVATEVAQLGEFQRRRARWHGWPGLSWWVGRKYGTAAAQPHLDRIAAAASAYQPVRAAIERRIAEQQADRRELQRRVEQRHARQRQQAEVRFHAWQRRQALADEPLAGGPTPREMAATGRAPASWPSQVTAVVGDVETWWARVRASVRNEHARATAVAEVVDAITAAATALEQANRPGIVGVDPRHRIYGWWVTFGWPELPDTRLLQAPPDIPVDHVKPGKWDYDGMYLPYRELLAAPWDRSGEYRFARSTHTGPSGYERPVWSLRSITEFVDSLFPARITYWPDDWRLKRVSTPITDHADPEVYVPHVQAVARHAVTTFRELAAAFT